MIQKSISDIKHIMDNLAIHQLKEEIKNYETDQRIGVQKLIEGYQKKLYRYEQEISRLEKMCIYENKYSHMKYIAGIDEVGRGPLSGPVVTAAVILPKGVQILYINDSKKLSEEKREVLYHEIMEKAIAVSIGMAHPEVIDEINILNATYKAMQQAIAKLDMKPDILLVDAVRIPDIDIPQEGIIKGDEKSISIAAASIIAKVTRDRMMQGYDELYPHYYFAKNKGYGTSEHITALLEHGPSPIHRHSFIKNIITAS